MKEKIIKKGDILNDESPRKFEISGGKDLPDSPEDKREMQPEETVIDIPDIKDIPGQEHVRPAPFGDLGDTTISSDDEEGAGLFDDERDNDDDDITMDMKTNVSKKEERDLRHAVEDVNTDDEKNLQMASLDNKDEEGEPLNESGIGKGLSGNNLDVPGPEQDDPDIYINEEKGEEDEENSSYSLGGDNGDIVENN